MMLNAASTSLASFASRVSRWAWVPAPGLLLAILALWVARPPGAFESTPLLTALNFTFSALASLAVAFLMGRDFLARPSLGTLLLGCGVLIWGLGSVVATAVSDGNGNVLITIHNTCVWLAACSHLAGVSLSRRSPSPLLTPQLWLVGAGSLALALVSAVALATLAGWLPVFFTERQGGTLVRQFVLGCAIAMLLLTAARLRQPRTRPWSTFAYWYAWALVLLAVGLLGVMLQSTHGSALSWAGRAAQYLGGAYMFAAAMARLRSPIAQPLPLEAKMYPAWDRYAGAVAIAMAAAIVRLVLLPDLGLRVTFITFYPAVIVAALYGGLGPGLLATAFSAALANFFWMEPVGRFGLRDFADCLALAVFCLSGTLISLLAATAHRAQLRAALAEEAARHAAEREQDAQALREALQQKGFLADVLASSSQPFAATGPDGHIRFFNHAFAQLTGYSRAELQSLDWTTDLTPAEWRAGEATQLEQLRRHKQPVRYQKQIRRKDGRCVPVELLVHRAGETADLEPACLFFVTDITERQQAESALHESEGRLRFALETCRVGAWDLDLEDHTTFRSLEHDRVFGYPALLPTWTYELFLEHVLPEDRAAVAAKYQQAIKTQGNWDFECRIRRADGKVRWIWAAGRHRRKAPENHQRMAGVVQDITERKEAEQALHRYAQDLEQANRALEISRQAALNLMEDALRAREQAEQATAQISHLSEQRRLALQAANLGTWDYRFQTGAVEWDERCRQMWGLAEAEQTPYATAISRIHPEDRARVDTAVNRALASPDGGAYREEFRVVWPDGSVHWIASYGQVYFEGTGAQRHAVRFIGANMEVTAEWQAKAALRESEERLAAFAAATFEGIAVSDRGRIVDCNEQLARMLGYTVDQLKGRLIVELASPADRQRVTENIQPGRESIIEHQMVRADGSLITVEAHGRPRHASRRGLRHTAVRDITEHKQREELLERLNRTLKALKDSSQAMMRATSEKQYLDEVCRILLEDCGYALAWIGFAEHDEAKAIRPISWCGFEEGYLGLLNLTWADTLKGRGPTGAAVRTGNPAVCADMSTDPAMAPWREEALKRGYASSLAVPILDEHRPSHLTASAPALGVITLYSHQPNAFREDEVNLLRQLARDVGYCIRVLRLREARARAEQRTELLAETAAQLLAAESPQNVVEQLCHRVLQLLDCQLFFNFLVAQPPGPAHPPTPVRTHSTASLNPPASIRMPEPASTPGETDAPAPQEWLHLNACGGIPAEEARRIEWLEFGNAVCGCVPRDACGMLVEDIQNRPDLRAALVKSYGVQAYACHPLLIGQKVLGTLSFGTRTRTRFTEEELALMRAVTDLVAIAMERQRAKAALQETAEELRRSNLDLEQFAYVASHDLQEPLRAVGGYVTLLQKRAGSTLDERGQEYVAGALEGALRMERLIRDLLTFSRVGTRGSKFVPTNLQEPLQQALQNLSASLRSVEATVTHDPLPIVAVDATQLMLVFQNLIGNALKFRGPQPPQVHVAARRHDGHWIVSVRDNGIGIEPQYYTRIFQLFQRLHTRTKYPGTGIGLAICKRVIERHGGAIWVESQPGKGSTFCFSIPEAGRGEG
jgi:PAS domain S-box-containing protein